MRKRNLFSIYLVLCVSLILSSCGKSDSNPANGVSNNSVISSPVLNNTLQDNALFQQFSAMMIESNFIQLNFPQNADINESTFLNFTEASMEESQNCNEVLGFLTFCSQASGNFNIASEDTFSRSFTKADSSVFHELGSTDTALIAEFRTILSQADDYSKGFGRFEHHVRAGNIVYTFDFSKPIYANPVYKQDLETRSGYRYIFSTYLQSTIF